MIKVLLITNESILERMLTVTLTINGLTVKSVSHLSDATAELSKDEYQLLMIDSDYAEVGDLIRQKGFTLPVLMFTDEADTQLDDMHFLPRPFDFPRLKEKMNGILKRKKSLKERLIEHGPLKIDLNNELVIVKDTIINLGKMEFAILVSLARKSGKIVSKEKMRIDLEAQGHFFNTSIYHHIKELKRKIQEESFQGLKIKSVTGEGYLLLSE